jgi:hypothetical protein
MADIGVETFVINKFLVNALEVFKKQVVCAMVAFETGFVLFEVLPGN